MNGFTHTWRLIRLALRRDRVKLPLWIIAIVGLSAVSIPALNDIYGNNPQAQIAYASSMSSSAIGRAFGGVIDGPTMGGITMVEMFAFTAVLVAFMSTTIIVRHTRYNEESGSSELISSGIVGRYASLTAAIAVMIGANVITGTLISLALRPISDFTGIASIGFGATLALVGCVFGSIAAVMVQLSQSTRSATALCTAAIVIAFLLRAIGDGFATVNADGLSTTAAWPSWLSPIGIGYQVFPLTQQHWYLLLILLGFIMLFIGLAFTLLRVRDIGLGLLPDRRGPSIAPRNLLSVMGLAWRLQRGVFIGWAIFFVVFGFIFGGMAQDFQHVLENIEGSATFLNSLEPGQTITDIFFGAMLGMAGIMAAGYGLQAILKMRSEESSGRLESVFGTSVHRARWMLSHIVITTSGVILLVGTIGVCAAVMYSVSGGSEINIAHIIEGSLLQTPAVCAFLGFAIMTFGILPRASVGIAWAMYIVTLVIFQFGLLLELPSWLMGLSPFYHTPTALGATVNWDSLLILSSFAVLLTCIGIIAFRRRDITLA